ncbi:LppU/SCO3897 family protein [Nocardia pseudobrasiliensis]|nr:hypothetical protein [Nocardia pseudobrasiliensis]
MARRRAHAGIILMGCVIAASIATAGLIGIAMSMGGNGEHRADKPGVAATSARPSATTTASQPVSSAPPLAPLVLNKGADQGKPVVDVAVGDCVSVGETTLEKTSCASGSGYRVAERAAAGAQCPGDADRSYTRTLPGGDPDNLCLDINWVVGDCVDLSGGAPRSVDCATPGRVRVQGIRPDTTDVNGCPASDRGVVYDQRRFVVCVSTR